MSGVQINAAAARIAEEFQRIGATPPVADESSREGGFGKVLESFLDDTNDAMQKAESSVTEIMTGEKQNVHEVMLDVAKADVSFRMMLEVRNKLVEAYQEVMRMSV